jgi:ATP-binding cassette subfamily C protein
MTRAGWRLLKAELRPHRRSLLAVVGLAVLLSVPMFASGLLVARALDEGFLVRRVDVGLFWLGVLAQIRIAAAVLTKALYPFLVRIVEPLRDRLVAAAAMAGLDRALRDDGPSPGSAVRQATDEAEGVRRLVAAVLRNIHTTLSVAAGALIGLAVLNPVAALVELPCLAAAGTVYWLLVRLALRWQRRAIMAEEDLAEQAARMFAARRDIVAFAAEWTAARAVQAGIQATRRTSLMLARIGILRAFTVGLGVDVALLLLLVLAPALVSAGQLTSGDLVAAVFYVMFGLGPAVRFLVYGGAGWLVSLLGLMSRLSEVVTAAPAHVEDREPPPPVPSDPTVTLDRVTFAYSPTATPVLDDVTLTIPYGAHVAVVGVSGTGKSTLATVICGLRRPCHGTVRVGGTDVEALPAQTVALVPQESYVFAGTVRENLRYLAPDLPDRALLHAATLFGLDDVIRRHGLDGELPPGGGGLSAGERQLITLARTYLSPAPVVILDEATSHLDPVAEYRAERRLRERGGTLIVIAHRISSAQRATLVLLVDSGKVVAGTHQSLLVSTARYRELAGHWDANLETHPVFKHHPVLEKERRP